MNHANNYYLPEKWPQYMLSLSEEGSFVDVFNSGLNPHYVPGMEDVLVEVKHARVTIRLPDGRVLPQFSVEHSEIRPLPDGSLYKIIFVSQPLTIEQAREMVRPWLPFIDKKREELDAFLRAVEADPVRYSDADFGAAPEGFAGGWSGSEGERFSVWFRQNYNIRVPLRLCFRVNYRRARTLDQFTDSFKSSIPAPEGYEIQKTEHYGPDDTAEMMYAKGIPFLPGRGLSGIGKNEVIEKPEAETLDGNLLGNQNKAKNIDTASRDLGEEGALFKSVFFRIVGGVFIIGAVVMLIGWVKSKLAS